jgi:hypothetical protein
MAVGDRDFDRFLPCSDFLSLDDDLKVSVLRLQEIIAMKEQLGREKDLAALPMLRTALRLSPSSGREPLRDA